MMSSIVSYISLLVYGGVILRTFGQETACDDCVERCYHFLGLTDWLDPNVSMCTKLRSSEHLKAFGGLSQNDTNDLLTCIQKKKCLRGRSVVFKKSKRTLCNCPKLKQARHYDKNFIEKKGLLKTYTQLDENCVTNTKTKKDYCLVEPTIKSENIDTCCSMLFDKSDESQLQELCIIGSLRCLKTTHVVNFERIKVYYDCTLRIITSCFVVMTDTDGLKLTEQCSFKQAPKFINAGPEYQDFLNIRTGWVTRRTTTDSTIG